MALKEINLLTTDNVKDVTDTAKPRVDDVASAESVQRAISEGLDIKVSKLDSRDIFTKMLSPEFLPLSNSGDASFDFSSYSVGKVGERLVLKDANGDVFATQANDGTFGGVSGVLFGGKATGDDWTPFLVEAVKKSDIPSWLTPSMSEPVQPVVLTIDSTTNSIMMNGTPVTSFAKLVSLASTGSTRLKYDVAVEGEVVPVLYSVHHCSEDYIKFDASGFIGNHNIDRYTHSVVCTKAGTDSINLYMPNSAEKILTGFNAVSPYGTTIPNTGKVAAARETGIELMKCLKCTFAVLGNTLGRRKYEVRNARVVKTELPGTSNVNTIKLHIAGEYREIGSDTWLSHTDYVMTFPVFNAENYSAGPFTVKKCAGIAAGLTEGALSTTFTSADAGKAADAKAVGEKFAEQFSHISSIENLASNADGKADMALNTAGWAEEKANNALTVAGEAKESVADATKLTTVLDTNGRVTGYKLGDKASPVLLTDDAKAALFTGKEFTEALFSQTLSPEFLPITNSGAVSFDFSSYSVGNVGNRLVLKDAKGEVFATQVDDGTFAGVTGVLFGGKPSDATWKPFLIEVAKKGDIPKATAMKPTDEEGVWQVDEGSADPWEQKQDVMVRGGALVDTKKAKEDIVAFCSEANTAFNEAVSREVLSDKEGGIKRSLFAGADFTAAVEKVFDNGETEAF